LKAFYMCRLQHHPHPHLELPLGAWCWPPHTAPFKSRGRGADLRAWKSYFRFPIDRIRSTGAPPSRTAASCTGLDQDHPPAQHMPEQTAQPRYCQARSECAH
jgi:hypothetical protein